MGLLRLDCKTGLQLLPGSIGTHSLSTLSHHVKYLTILNPPSCEKHKSSAETLLDKTPYGVQG